MWLLCLYSPGLAALELTGPGAVSGLWGRSVSVPCQYHERYQETPKYWCSGIIWQSCSKVVETTGSEAEVKRDTVSIRDNHTLHMFTVTLENLTLGDTGIYWCGINLRSKSDFNFPVSVTVLQGESLLPSLCGTAEPTYSSRLHSKDSSSTLLQTCLLQSGVLITVAWRGTCQEASGSCTSPCQDIS
uniref:Immunoglobulin domain-containing protein n=1 Tax=Gopherus evgoodei TaxID=1825980 RepID=A0A8C4WA47_9SAUR